MASTIAQVGTYAGLAVAAAFVYVSFSLPRIPIRASCLPAFPLRLKPPSVPSPSFFFPCQDRDPRPADQKEEAGWLAGSLTTNKKEIKIN